MAPLQEAQDFLGMNARQLTQMLAWLSAEEGRDTSTADDLGTYLRAHLVEKWESKEHSMAQDRVARPQF